MTRADLVNNLGTVAKSGTTNFVEALSEGADLSLIGQFGVGFYSIYLVSDKVRVVSKNNNDDQHVWESTADSNFVVAKDPRGNTLGRGTEITMFLKEDAIEFTQIQKLEELIKRYSEFITFPIYLYKEVDKTTEEDEDDEGDDEDSSEDTTTDNESKDSDEDDVEVEDDEEEATETKKITEKTREWIWDRVNSNVAILSSDKEDVRYYFYKIEEEFFLK
jgi:heat shock protein beta